MTISIDNLSIQAPLSGAAPATPPADHVKVYADANGLLNTVDEAGDIHRAQLTDPELAAVSDYAEAVGVAELGDVLQITELGPRFTNPFPKKYIGLITQFGTSDPIYGSVHDTIGGPVVITRTGIGMYEVVVPHNPNIGQFTATIAPPPLAGSHTGLALTKTGFPTSVAKVTIATYVNGIASDGVLSNSTFDLTVYI